MTSTEQRLAALEAEVAELRRQMVLKGMLLDAIYDEGYRGRPRERPRHPGFVPAAAPASPAPGQRGCAMKSCMPGREDCMSAPTGLNVPAYLTAYFDECGRNGGKPLAGRALERFLPWNASPEDLRTWAQPPPTGPNPRE